MLHAGSFENEALENEDRSTKHPKLENEAPKSRKRSTLSRKRSTQNSKTKTPKSRKRKLETTVGLISATLRLTWRNPNHMESGCEAADASTPPKVHKIHPKLLDQLFHWTFLDRISCINFNISLAILDTLICIFSVHNFKTVRDLGASFSSFGCFVFEIGCFVFEIWVLRFRVLGTSCFGLRFRVLRFRNYLSYRATRSWSL